MEFLLHVKREPAENQRGTSNRKAPSLVEMGIEKDIEPIPPLDV